MLRMTKLTSVLLLGCVVIPVSVFAQANAPAPATTAISPARVQIANAYQVPAIGPDRRYRTTEMMLLVSPEVLARRGLSLVGNADMAYGLSGGTAGIRRSWARRLTDGHDFFINGYAQLAVGRMETAVTVANGYGGRVVQPSVGLEVTRKAFAVFMQADYRVAPARPEALAARVADVRGLRLVVGSGWRFGVRDQPDAPSQPARAPAPAPAPRAPVHRNPRIEVAVGANGPQYWTAEFPGINFSVAANVLRSRNWGAALVAEVDSSYVRVSRSAGARLFARTSSLESGGRGATAWVQLLAGHADGDRQGIIVSNGGRVTQPGAGLAIGSARKSVVVQVDRQNVDGGLIHDEMRGDVAPMSRTRTTVGFVWRFLDR